MTMQHWGQQHNYKLLSNFKNPRMKKLDYGIVVIQITLSGICKILSVNMANSSYIRKSLDNVNHKSEQHYVYAF